MADEVRRVNYYVTTVSNKPGEASRILTALKDAGVNLIAFSGFPYARQAQIDLIPENDTVFKQAAKSARLKASAKKTGFLIQGDDRPGALAELTSKLAGAGINITSLQAVCAGSGRYGGLFWVKPEDVRKAAKVLGAA